MSENVGASTSRNPKGLHGLYGENFTFTLPLFSSMVFILDYKNYLQKQSYTETTIPIRMPPLNDYICVV
jgi:hypothetical protein